MSATLLFAIGVTLMGPLVLYVWAALRTPPVRVLTPAGYFVAFRQVGTAPFANSSVAYAFQVATLFPFLYWGMQGQMLPVLVNTICWGGGILLFRRHLGIILKRLNASGKPRTLHGLLGSAFSSRGVQLTAAWVTIIGMLGVALAEAYWGMQVVRVLVREDTTAFYVIVFATLLFVLAYVWYAGTWGSMKTDMLQLVFSYFGLTATFALCLATVWSKRLPVGPDFALVSGLLLMGGAASLLVRYRGSLALVASMESGSRSIAPHVAVLEARQVDDGPTWPALPRLLSTATIVALVLLTLSFGVLFVWSLPAAGWAPFVDPGDPKWHGVLALLVMPLAFQFVDMSAWQRLQAIAGSGEEAFRRARQGLLLFAIESPFSWLLCAGLGMLLRVSVPELATATDKAGPLAALPRLLIESGSWSHIGVALMFMMAVMGVMLSTIDSTLLAAMYAYVADVRACTFDDEDRQGLLAGKKAAFWLLVGVSLGIIVLGATLGTPDRMIGIMVAFYGAMLSLLPAAVMMLLDSKRYASKPVIASIVAGVLSSLACAIWGLFDSDKSWYGVLAALIVPAVVLAISPRRRS